MVNVKINGKTYKVGEMKFGDFTHMEEQGFSITDAFAKNQYMLGLCHLTLISINRNRHIKILFDSLDNRRSSCNFFF